MVNFITTATAGIFSPIDVSFGRFLERIDGGNNPSLFAAAFLVSRSVREGNVCLDLTVGRYEITNGLPVSRHSDRRARRNELGHASTKFPNTYFGSFHQVSFKFKHIL